MRLRAAIVAAISLTVLRPALALDAFQPTASVELPEAFIEGDGVALERLGLRLVVRPENWRQQMAAGLKPFGGSGRGLAITPRLDSAQRASVSAYAVRGACRLVLHAERGLSEEAAARLMALGPCFFDVRLGADPAPLAPTLARLKPATIVWEAGGTLPESAALAKFAQLPQPVLGVDASLAPAALAALERLGDRRLALRLHADRGVLDKSLIQLLRAPGRGPHVTIVAHKGLDPVAARRLRTLPRCALELALENGVPPGLVAAAEVFARPVDPLDQRPVSDDEADAPLLSFPMAP